MRRLLALFFFAFPLAAQTIQNGSFEQTPVPVGTWNFGPIPGWQFSNGTGLWQPSTQYFSSALDGKTVAWISNGSISQDLGAPGQANANYSFTVYVGHRSDGYATPFTISVAAGGGVFCITSGASSSVIPFGTIMPFVLKCPIGPTPTVGNLVLTISSQGSQLDVDNVTVTSDAPPPPLVISLAGMATTFPMNSPPACAPADGLCIFSVRVCLVDGVTCMNASEGTLWLVKTTSNNGEQAVIVAKAVKTP